MMKKWEETSGLLTHLWEAGWDDSKGKCPDFQSSPLTSFAILSGWQFSKLQFSTSREWRQTCTGLFILKSVWMLSRSSHVLLFAEGVAYSPPGFSVHGDSPDKIPGVGCHALLQGIFPTQRLNLCLIMSPALAGGFFTSNITWETLF